jgi:hypothetical protein
LFNLTEFTISSTKESPFGILKLVGEVAVKRGILILVTG